MAVRGDESGRGAHNHDVKEHRPFSGRVLLIAVVALLAALTGVHVLGTGADGRSPAAAESHPTLAAESSSGVVHSEVIGYSAQHRPIVARELGDPHATYRAVVLGSMHGFYERAGETVTRAMRTMTIPVGIQLWVIDTINPDGDALQQRGNAHGVDLNRNWPYSWIPISRSGCTPFVCHYSGPHALSEPESVAMRTFLTRIKPQRVVSIHQPLDGVDTTDGGAKDPAFRNALARNLNLPLRAFTCYGGCHGTLTGWLTHSTTTTGITVELPQTVASSYLTGTAARGILSALMVGVRVPARPAVSRVVGAAGAAGPSAGGNTVTIDGSGFTTGWRVTFGGVPGTRLKVISTHRITVVAPRHSAGLVSVRVTGVGGTSSTTTKARYTYLAPPTVRTVTGTSHATGPTAGGNTVTITGTGFTTITRVTFGSTRATAVRRLSTTRLTAVAPRHTAGVVSVRVTGVGGTSSTTTEARYTYLAPPTVRTVTGTSHATGPTAGGNTVTITGVGFTGITRVSFGSTAGHRHSNPVHHQAHRRGAPASRRDGQRPTHRHLWPVGPRRRRSVHLRRSDRSGPGRPRRRLRYRFHLAHALLGQSHRRRFRRRDDQARRRHGAAVVLDGRHPGGRHHGPGRDLHRHRSESRDDVQLRLVRTRQGAQPRLTHVDQRHHRADRRRCARRPAGVLNPSPSGG